MESWLSSYDSSQWFFRLKRVPVNQQDIYSRILFFNPFNHPSVVFSASAVRAAGGYMDIPSFEDYHLWHRMIALGFLSYNIPQPLVVMRRSSTLLRRSGFNYFIKELNFCASIFRINFLSSLIIALRAILRPIISFSDPFKLRRELPFCPVNHQYAHELRILSTKFVDSQ